MGGEINIVLKSCIPGGKVTKNLCITRIVQVFRSDILCLWGNGCSNRYPLRWFPTPSIFHSIFLKILSIGKAKDRNISPDKGIFIGDAKFGK